MRVIGTPALVGLGSRHAFDARMRARGYLDLGAGASGASVLARPNEQLVYKLGDDPALRAFTEYLRTSAPTPALPRAFAVTEIGSPWTLLVVERLRHLDVAGTAAWAAWLSTWHSARGTPPTDPFGMVAVLHSLGACALATGCEIDLNASNIMVRPRTGEIVLSDPLF